MRLLLDTPIALWAIVDDPRLPEAAAALIRDETNDIIVSAASIWEIAIKHRLARGGAGDMPLSAAEARRYFEEAGYALLPISADHAATLGGLPLIHGDPFDRMLIAQALHEPLRLLTCDTVLAHYGEMVLLC